MLLACLAPAWPLVPPHPGCRVIERITVLGTEIQAGLDFSMLARQEDLHSPLRTSGVAAQLASCLHGVLALPIAQTVWPAQQNNNNITWPSACQGAATTGLSGVGVAGAVAEGAREPAAAAAAALPAFPAAAAALHGGAAALHGGEDVPQDQAGLQELQRRYRARGEGGPLAPQPMSPAITAVTYMSVLGCVGFFFLFK